MHDTKYFLGKPIVGQWPWARMYAPTLQELKGCPTSICLWAWVFLCLLPQGWFLTLNYKCVLGLIFLSHAKTKTKTKCFKESEFAMFSKSREFKDFKYGIGYCDQYVIFYKIRDRGFKDIISFKISTKCFPPTIFYRVFSSKKNSTKCIFLIAGIS